LKAHQPPDYDYARQQIDRTENTSDEIVASEQLPYFPSSGKPHFELFAHD